MPSQISTTSLSEVMGALRRQFPLLILLSCLLNLLLLVASIYMLQVYDRVLSSGSLDTLLWLTLIAIFAVVIYGVLEQARRVVLSRGRVPRRNAERAADVLRVQALRRRGSPYPFKQP